MADEVVTQRQELVKQSEEAYSQAVNTPTDADAPEENWAEKLLLLLDVLVTEARIARYDRESPTEVAELPLDDCLGDLDVDPDELV